MRIFVTVAEELKVDLIVMPTHGNKGIKRMILGSVAERVVREATWPVLTIGSDSRNAGNTAA